MFIILFSERQIDQLKWPRLRASIRLFASIIIDISETSLIFKKHSVNHETKSTINHNIIHKRI